MFRRKEEGTADSSDVSNTTGTNTTPSGAGSEAAATGAASSSLLGSQASSFSQAPQMQPVVRTITDVARTSPAGSPTAPSQGYRPSPVSDFSRGVSRPGEAQRPGVAHPTHAAGVAAAGEKGSKPNPRILTVGNDILLKGEIATCDRIIIEGRVEAKLHDVHTVEIAVSGSFKGTAEVEEAEVSGLFEGDLAVRTRLIIYSTGEVRGNITYGEIEIERGGKLTGQIKTNGAAGDKSSLLDALENKHGRSGKDKEAAA